MSGMYWKRKWKRAVAMMMAAVLIMLQPFSSAAEGLNGERWERVYTKEWRDTELGKGRDFRNAEDASHRQIGYIRM